MGIVKVQSSMSELGNKVIAKTKKLAKTALSTMAVMFVMTFPSLASGFTVKDEVTINADNVDAVNVVTKTLNVICTFARIAGIFIAVGGVITYIYGYIENNPNAQSKAYPMIAGGIALLSLGTLITHIFGS